MLDQSQSTSLIFLCRGFSGSLGWTLAVIEQGVEASKLLMLPAKSLSEQLKLLCFTFFKAWIENEVSK
jgi:hypothetical protein